ncbi:hypothetical protein D910_07229 [Dendroctonus ponderosae]|uniref:VWFD domain-containing protein n=1 Tax=Dendroctonus ponderosae TaxID=77166 RepID=U4UIW2_DENPD|nr:hypothetical protein D910_07229 [Dendroctonus ponderosae]
MRFCFGAYNGLVECKNTCPKTDGCHLVVTDGCCKVCKGCNYKGVAYASHTDWSEPANPCKVMRCEAGVVTISDMHCYTPCPNPLPPEPGKCCPTCSVCKFNGQVVAEDRDVVSEDDPCLKCRCSRGRLTCAKRSCPVLQCSRAMQERAPGECCPRCNGTRAILLVPNTCPIQRSFFREGQALKLDKCIECACVNSTSVCTRSACPILECAPELQRTFPAHCCPTCIQQPTDELISQCHYAGHAYEAGTSRATPPSRFNARFVRQDGNVWKLDACSSCECHDGKVSCARIRCNTTCAAGMKQINVEGECCPQCVELEGACMAFGDPHYKTFDGKIYTFKAMGRYQLVEQCGAGNNASAFSIKVANYATPHYMDSPITKRVAISYGGARLNLQQRLRVKYNGRRVGLNFERAGQFALRKLPEGVEVRLHNGVVVVWNGRSFLEVTAPAAFKGRLCGLCGNFNGDLQDELRLRSGKTVGDKDVGAFGASWCVGKRAECAQKPKTTRRTHGDVGACKHLNGRDFGACESQLSNTKYYKACKMDMFNCAHGKCYCESLTAYSRECERLGVQLPPNWLKNSRCDARSLRQSHARATSRPSTSTTKERLSKLLHQAARGQQPGAGHARQPIPIQ